MIQLVDPNPPTPIQWKDGTYPFGYANCFASQQILARPDNSAQLCGICANWVVHLEQIHPSEFEVVNFMENDEGDRYAQCDGCNAQIGPDA